MSKIKKIAQILGELSKDDIKTAGIWDTVKGLTWKGTSVESFSIDIADLRKAVEKAKDLFAAYATEPATRSTGSEVFNSIFSSISSIEKGFSQYKVERNEKKSKDLLRILTELVASINNSVDNLLVVVSSLPNFADTNRSSVFDSLRKNILKIKDSTADVLTHIVNTKIEYSAEKTEYDFEELKAQFEAVFNRMASALDKAGQIFDNSKSKDNVDIEKAMEDFIQKYAKSSKLKIFVKTYDLLNSDSEELPQITDLVKILQNADSLISEMESELGIASEIGGE